MANDNTKLQTETSADKARRSKLRIETEMGARKTAEAIGEEHVVVDSKLRKERERKKLTPEDEKKRNRFDDDVDGLLSEKIFDGWKIGILSQGEMSSKARGLFINNRKKRLAKELYGEKYKTFAKVCEQYVDWMKQWLEKTEEERDEDDKRYLLDDEWHEEEIVASLTFDDGEGELLPKGRAPLDLFFDALVEVCAEG